MVDKLIIGYKVMGFIDDTDIIRSGRNSNLTYSIKDLEQGKSIKMPGNGCYLGTNKDYVLDYYSNLAEKEILLTVGFYEKDIITGSLDDSEVEISVSNCIIINSFLLFDGSILSFIPQEKKDTLNPKESEKLKLKSKVLKF